MEGNLLTILAKPHKRYIASIIDGCMVGLLVLPFIYFGRVIAYEGNELIYFTVSMFIYKVIIYLLIDFLIPCATKGKTIGRYLMNIRMVKQNGSNARTRNYLMRALIFIVIAVISDLLNLSFVAYIIWVVVFILSIYWMYNDDYRRTVHDKIAGTMMIEDMENICEE